MFFLLLFVQSFNAITSDTSPHQTSGLSLPLKRLTDDGPDTGNYYVRTVTANFNHNVPCERGRNQPRASTAAQGLGTVGRAGVRSWSGPESWMLCTAASFIRGCSRGQMHAQEGTCRALSPSRLWDFGSWFEWELCTSGQTAFLALSSTAQALSELLCSMAVSPPAGPFPAWLSPPCSSGCLTEHRGCWLGSAVTGAFLTCAPCEAGLG